MFGSTRRRTRRGVVAALSVVLGVTALSPTPAGAVAGFGDVPAGAFYAASVQWMVDNGITSGTSEGCFGPDETTTRGMAATFLHRFMGEPDGGSESFSDVEPGHFFHAAVAWMVDEGITTGFSPTTFEPERRVTRGEMAAFLHRVAGEPDGGDALFADVGPDDFFHAAVAWMVDEGITTGTSPTTFDPYRAISRGEIATFLYRFAGEPAVTVSGHGLCPESGFEAELAAAEARSFELLNELRADLGLGTLTRRGDMDAFARDWSDQMDANRGFRHSDGPWAENIAWWSAGWATPEHAAERLHELWVDSPGHFANMTHGSYTEVGIGFWRSDDGWHATHVFS